MGRALLVSDAVDSYKMFLKSKRKKNSYRAFRPTLNQFCEIFSDDDVRDVTPSDISTFIEMVAGDLEQSTKSSKKTHISALYGHVRDVLDVDMTNPCSSALVRKLYKAPRGKSPVILEKELVDELIYSEKNLETRRFFECMARSAMRIGEALQIRVRNIDLESSTVAIENPKSGRKGEVVYFKKKLIQRLYEYAMDAGYGPADRVFPFSYSTGRRRVRIAGKALGVVVKPHDFRRFAATQASRNGMPLELVSKVVLRHADLATTQRYLGLVDAVEAHRMVENYME